MGNDFVFITHSAANGAINKETDHFKVRKKAMQTVATIRRERGDYRRLKKQNTRQYPIYEVAVQEIAPAGEEQQTIEDVPLGLENPLPYVGPRTIARDESTLPTYDVAPSGPQRLTTRPTAESRDTNSRDRCRGEDGQALIPGPRTMSATGFETVKHLYGVDIHELSSLTTIHVGRAAASLLATKPSILPDLLGCTQKSYLCYLSDRYGRNAYFDDAVNCLSAKMKQVLRGKLDHDDSSVISTYGKALRSLQGALNDPVQCVQADALCATQILALFEFLNFSGGQTWHHHTTGASRLIQLRGPFAYTTDFEKSLLNSFTGIIFVEALLSNQPCFLAEPLWKETLTSLISEDSSTHPFTDRSPLLISLWKYLLPGAGLFRDVTALIYSSQRPNPGAITSFISRANTTRENFLAWRKTYDSLISQGAPATIPEEEVIKRYQVCGLYMSCLALLNRVLGAACSSRRRELEKESQMLASVVCEMEKRALVRDPMAGFFLSQKVSISKSLVESKGIWLDEEEMGEVAGEEKLIERWRFEGWCRMLGRALPN